MPDQVLTRVVARVERDRGNWRFSYTLTGDLDRLRLPAAQPPGPADGLWRHTCCEVFVATAGLPAYREFNFSPSGQWAAYAFRATRQPDAGATAFDAPRLFWHRQDETMEFTAELDADWLPAGEALDIGLSVVAEDIDGKLAYWALAHPSPQPDFHHRDAFALRVASQVSSRPEGTA